MKRLLSFAENKPIFTLVMLFLITALSTLQLPNLRFDISAQSMIVKSDPAWLEYQKNLKTFGSDNTVVIFIKDDDLLTQKKITLLKNLKSQIETLPFVTSTKSLFNVPNIKEVDDYIITDAYLKDIPNNQHDFDVLLKEALANPLVANNFISKDGKSMAINVSLDGGIHKVDADRLIAQSIQDIIDPLEPEFDALFQMGASYIRDEISKQIKLDQLNIAPAALLALVIVLGFSLKHVNCSIVPVMTASISIILTLALMSLLDVSINVLTSIVPALILIIGSTEDVHLMTEYQLGINSGLDRKSAVSALSSTQSLAITLTFITTFIGFLSISLNDIEILRQFGWIVSIGLLFNFLVTVLFVPAYFVLFGGQDKGGNKENNIYQRMSVAVFKTVIRFKKTSLLLIVSLVLFFAWGAQFVKVNNNTIEFFQHDSAVYQRAQVLHQQLAGIQTFSVILESNIEGTFTKTRYVEEIQAIQQYLQSLEVFDQSFSFADFMMMTHKVMEGTDELFLPIEDETIQAYLALIDNDNFSDYVSSDFSTARILVRHHISSSYELKQHLTDIQNYFDNTLNSQLKIYFTGESVLTNKAADTMAISQVQSLLLMVVVILVLVSALFIDIRAGILAIIPNVFPVIILFGVMGYFDIPLDTGTAMVAIIALGICVDDTIHFFSRYHHFTRGEQDKNTALFKTAKHEATPITITSIALAVGFLTLTLSSFQPVVHFGALSALVMLMALFATFVLTPILLSYTRLITVWDMMELNLKSAVINNSEFFRGLKDYEIKKAILSGSIVHFKEDDIIVEQDEEGVNFYVVLEGRARVSYKDNEGSVNTLDYLQTGDIFGEIAQLTGQKRTARVTASEPTKALEIKWDELYQLGRFHPRVSLKLYRNMSAIIGKRMSMQINSRGYIRDELTGAVTKSFVLEQIQIEIDRAIRHQECFTNVMLHIDFLFKNDAYCPKDYERRIKALTAVVAHQVRSVDIFARCENEQFIIVMPKSTAVEAALAINRMKEAIVNDKNNIGRIHLTVAVSEFKEGDEVEHIITRLNDHITEQKEDGKSLHMAKV